MHGWLGQLGLCFMKCTRDKLQVSFQRFHADVTRKEVGETTTSSQKDHDILIHDFCDIGSYSSDLNLNFKFKSLETACCVYTCVSVHINRTLHVEQF